MQGSFVALITPFDARGRVDSKRLKSLVQWHVEEGTDGLICFGTTGETLSLSDSEKSRILEVCLEAADNRILVIAGTGSADTKRAVQASAKAQKLGAQGSLVVAPYYNKPTQEGCFLHYKEISAVGLPFIVYNNPSRCAVQLSVDTIAKIAELPCAVALKESTNDLSLIDQIRSRTSLPILAGEDRLALAMLKKGAVGAVSVIGNAIPRPWKCMIECVQLNRLKRAELINSFYQPLLEALSKETNPQGIKYLLSLMGKCLPKLRLPLIEPTLEHQNEIKRELLSCALPRCYSPMSCTKSI